MNSMPVENHIRGVVKDLLRTRGIAKTGLVTDIHGTKKIPISNQKYRISIQVTSPSYYGILKIYIFMLILITRHHRPMTL